MSQPQPTRPEPVARWEWALLAVLLTVGGALRVWAASRAPGLWYDEAIYGLDSLDVLRKPGYWPVFFATEGHMREPMWMYIQAVMLAITGPSAFAIRLTSAIVGTVTIPVVWLLAREYRGPLFAALAAFLFTFMRWHLHFSGLAFRTILSPLFCALVLLFFLRMLRTRSQRDAAITGLFLGLGLYTYLAFRLMPFILLVPMAGMLWRESERRGHLLRLYGVLVAVSLVVFLPLGIDYLRHPDHFTGRSDEVSVFDRPDAASLLLKQARDVALMPLLRGDHVGKHNLPGPPRFYQWIEMDPKKVTDLWDLDRPIYGKPLDPHGTGVPVFGIAGGLLFYVGLGCILFVRRREPSTWLLVSALVIGSMASVLSYGAPNMLRLIFLTPVVIIILTGGVFSAGEILHRRVPSVGRGALCALLGVFLLLHVYTELRRLSIWPTHPMVIREFNRELADVAEYLAKQPDRLPVLLPAAFINDEGLAPATMRFIADGYTFNPPGDQLGDHWWEFRPVSPFPQLKSVGERLPGGRSTEIFHPLGVFMGNLVEVERPKSADAPTR